MSRLRVHSHHAAVKYITDLKKTMPKFWVRGGLMLIRDLNIFSISSFFICLEHAPNVSRGNASPRDWRNPLAKRQRSSELDFGHSRWIASEVGQAVEHGTRHFDGI